MCVHVFLNLLFSYTSVNAVHPAFAIPTKSLSAPFMIDTHFVARTGLAAHTGAKHTHTHTHTQCVFLDTVMIDKE